ncbi:hypothetical protein KF707_02585 [Candidatus Obscuribacterales bacterium]|nr:hypothetical protein [Candidatus Obscuribacterales bacterium]MBX3135094.1 hypothetical protein [Candidatus Obscuribacterales bacterium]MBX3150911.1 hypothetical protein [Candidatus Obscuribacterales bacterium]
MAFNDDVHVLSIRYPSLAKGLGQCVNLDKAFRFLESENFPLAQMDVIAQDEFSHDVCVPFPDNQAFIVIGAT